MGSRASSGARHGLSSNISNWRICCAMRSCLPDTYVLLLAGHGADTIDRFWSIVLLAVVPLLRTAAVDADARAPCHRAELAARRASSIRQVNLAVLNRASVQWNTFPSGHTAASVATALAVAGDMPLAGLVLGVVAVSIAAGSVVGRYHYAADAHCGSCRGDGRVRYGNRRARTVTDGRFTVTSRLFGGTSLDGRAYTTWY